MTELERLIEEKRSIERRIRELRNTTRTYGKDGVLKVESTQRCAKSKDFYKVSVKRQSYNDRTDNSYMALVEVPVENKEKANDFLADIYYALREYLETLDDSKE